MDLLEKQILILLIVNIFKTDGEEYFRDLIRKHSKKIAITQLDTYVKGRLGLVIDSTGRDYGVISRQVNMLKHIGYDCYMVFVNTSLDVALERNKSRERSIPEYITKKSWQKVQLNMGAFQRIFGPAKMLIVDNSRNEKELVTKTLSTASRFIRSRLRTKPENRTAMAWIKRELELKKRK